MNIYDEKDIISLKDGGCNIKFIMEKHNIKSVKTIYDIIRRNGRNHKVPNKKYSCDYDFFENINDENKSYWLGFLYADGFVRKKKNSYELKIKLKNDDYTHIKKFNDTLKSNYPIKKDIKSVIKTKNKKYESYCCSLSIYNEKIVKDLFDKGCVNKKTQKIRLPNLNNELMNHFIRGYFDGDGCIYKVKNCNSFVISIVSNKYFVNNIKNFLTNNIHIENIYIIDKNNCSILQISNYTDVVKFKNYLYNNSTIYLERKKYIFDMIK